MSPKVYSEILAVLKMLGEEYKSKLPKKMVDFFEKNKDRDYIPIYDIDIPIEKAGISEETLNFITFLNLKYWCNENEKEKILVSIN